MLDSVRNGEGVIKPRAGALVVFAIAAALIAWRESRRPVPTTAAAPMVTPASGARIVLYVDLGEVDEAEGCGAIIRAVRRAQKSGVATEEIDARSSESPAKYRLLVAPAVLILDPAGHELSRFEGESPKTVRAIETAVDQLTTRR